MNAIKIRIAVTNKTRGTPAGRGPTTWQRAMKKSVLRGSGKCRGAHDRFLRTKRTTQSETTAKADFGRAPTLVRNLSYSMTFII